jgi:hypothetical protein
MENLNIGCITALGAEIFGENVKMTIELRAKAKRWMADLVVPKKLQITDYDRGKSDYEAGFRPEEDATYWYMDGYNEGERQ